MNTIETVNCDLCGSSDYTVVWDKTDNMNKGRLTSVAIFDSDNNIINGKSVMCNKCGLVYISPRMTEECTRNYYETEYRNTYKIENTSERYHAIKAIEYLIETGTIKADIKLKTLDIGCSTGELVKVFKNGEFNSYGVEQNSETSNIAINNGLNVSNCRVEDYDDSNFDLVTIVNTLEHMHSPTNTLNKIHSVLKDDGKILIIVPYLYTRNCSLSGDMFMSNAHLYQFDMDTIKQYMNKCGFEILHIGDRNEFNMNKIYCIARKAEPKPIDINYKFIPVAVTDRLNCMNVIYITHDIKTNNRWEG